MKGYHSIPKVTLVTVGALGVVLCAGLWLLGKADPNVGGKSVEEWMFRAAVRGVDPVTLAGMTNRPGLRAQLPVFGQASLQRDLDEAVNVLRKLGGKAEPALIRNLKAQDPFWAQAYVSFYKKVPEFVRRHLEPPYRIFGLNRRQSAIMAIGRVGRVSPALEVALRQACEDPDNVVQEKAALILLNRGSNSRETAHAIEAVVKRKEARNAQVMSSNLMSSNPNQEVILRTPTHLGYELDFTPATLEEMVVDLDRPYDEMRYVAANALQKLGPAAAPAVPALVRRLSDTNELVRNASIRALGNIGPGASNALAALRGFIGNESRFTESAAKEAIEKIERR